VSETELTETKYGNESARFETLVNGDGVLRRSSTPVETKYGNESAWFETGGGFFFTMRLFHTTLPGYHW